MRSGSDKVTLADGGWFMSFTLTLIRHGESTANVDHMLSGWMNVNLTARGRAELESLRQTVRYPSSDIYFSSPLQRCLDTFHILFPGKTPVVSNDFREINFRHMEGHVLKTKDDIASYFSDWVADRPHLDEETFSDVARRARPAIVSTVKKCLEDGLHSATVVMHSGIMRVSVVTLFGMHKETFNRMSVPNGLGYVITFDDKAAPVYFEKLSK